MALSDFLTEGSAIPAGSAVKSMTSQTVLPDWYTNYAMQLLSNQQAVAARPYETAPMPRVAEFTPAQQQAFGMTGNAATAYQPALSAATAATEGALTAPGGLMTAQPYFAKAGQSTVANIGEYMNPYTEQVVNRIAEMGGRNLRETIMPEIEGRYIRAGQLGFGPSGAGTGTPSGMLTDTSRAVRDVQSDILGQQTAALQQGFTQAAGLSAADLARQASLGTTAAGLQTGDVAQRLEAAQQLGGLGSAAQQLGLAGAGALTGVGAQQQALNQQNLDVAYGDFLRQQGYPQEQINNMLATFRGVEPGVPKAALEEGITPTGVLPPSTAETIGGALSGVGSILAGIAKI